MLTQISNFFKNRAFPLILAYSAKFALRIIMMTCRVQIEGLDRFTQTSISHKCILMAWHNRLSLLPELLSSYAPQFNYAALISNSRDGEPLAIVTNSYKIGRSIRVSHNARYEGLQKVISHLKQGKEVVVITPDGPRGPCYKIKPGIILAARKTSARIVPMTWSADRFWTLNTWDQMIIPKPFATIKVSFGNGISLSDEKQKDLSADRILLQRSLEQLCDDTEMAI